ncbi:hypothetical protein ACQEVG_37075 [Streptomyces sp. CA-135486]|uniref:hypothetical protein n=1 Tax=Streptomyces sp. CA-135486 TaxID=3240049 RepID=UPI003D8F1619
MAEQLIDALSMDWKPEEFHDTFQEQVAKLSEAKRAGETVEKAEPPTKATNVVDLMDAPRASVDRDKSSTDRGKEKATSTGAPPARIKDAARQAPGRQDNDGEEADMGFVIRFPDQGRALPARHGRRYPRPLLHDPRGTPQRWRSSPAPHRPPPTPPTNSSSWPS